MDVPVVWVISRHSSTRQLIGLNLNRRGFRVMEALSPSDPQLRDVGPDLIVVDVDAPALPDDAMAKALRQVPSLRAVPIVLLLAEAPAKSHLSPLDPVRWVEKPVDTDAFLAAVWSSLPHQKERHKMSSSSVKFADRVRAIPGAEHMYMCYSCGTCVGSCMIQLTGEYTYNPRRLIQKVINGLEEEAFEDRTTWLCSACDLCYPTCPQKIRISDVMLAVKELAIEAGHKSPLKTATVNERTCVACGLCVSVCPYEAVSLAEKKAGGHTMTVASVDTERCMACGLCAATCRSASIELQDGFSNEVLMEDLWVWMRRTAPTPISLEEVAEWAVVPGEVSSPS